MFCNIQKVYASHIYGADLLYTYLGGDSYKISLSLYGDCNGNTFFRLPGSTPIIKIYKGNQLINQTFLIEDTSQRKNISPVCAAYKEKTVCDDPSSTLPGARRFVYSTIVSFSASPDWRIAFDGTVDPPPSPDEPAHQAGRSGNITNIQTTGTQIMYLEALLDNSEGPNSSPFYTSIPTPYYCVNIPQQYNLGAVDPDKDSMAFSLIPALLNATTSALYSPPFSGANPLAYEAGSFSYDNSTGQLKFKPDRVQRSLVVIKVEEYKNGRLIGSTMREMTFVVIPDCNNTPPQAKVDSNTAVGGIVVDNEINVCQKEPYVKLTIPTTDPDGNTVTVDINDVPSGATAKILNNNTPQPYITLEWQTDTLPVGAYNMYVTYTDDACPLAGTQTVTYTINIIRPTDISHKVLRPTGCIRMQQVEMNFTAGLTPRYVQVVNRNTGQVLREFTDTTGTKTDSFKKGAYRIYSTSSYLKCISQYDFDVVDSGEFPIPVIFDDWDVCLNDPIQPIDIRPVQGAEIRWYDMEKNLLHSTPAYSTSDTGKFDWIVTQLYDSCETYPDTFTITVHELPDINILNENVSLCTGDSVALQATGGVRYRWEPDDRWLYQDDTLVYAYVRQPQNYIVKGYSEYNCIGTDTIYFDKLDQCCIFFYPDAFTPNGDGLNDKWHPMTEANIDLYYLAVYNRWGERIFATANPNEKWDGTHNGKLCDMGTYNYYLRAKCVMGRQESYQGSVILIR